MSEVSDNNNNRGCGGRSAVQVVESPWFKKMYANASEFYEKDKVLDANDRYELQKIYASIRNSQLYGGWLGFSAVFIPPFFIKYYQTGDVKGVRVPRNAIFGFAALMISAHLASEYAYGKAIQKLDPDGTFKNRNKYGDETSEFGSQPGTTINYPVKTSKERQYEMLSLLKIGSPTMWSNYFQMTYKNPNKRFPDPAEKLKEFKEGKLKNGSFLNRKDPFQLYSGPKHEKGEGVKPNNADNVPDKNVFTVDPYDKDFSFDDYNKTQYTSGNSSWDRVRDRANDGGISDPNDSSESIFGFEDELLDKKKKS